MTMEDIPIFITSDQTSSERRISPTWTIEQLKKKLETITGIPPSNQHLSVYGSSSGSAPLHINPSDDQVTLIGQFNLVPYGRIHVGDTRPNPGQFNINDVSKVDKYVLPTNKYESRQDSVLAWKKRNQLGRFDPGATLSSQSLVEESFKQIQQRQIEVGSRCKVSTDESLARIGTVKFVGTVPEIKGHQLFWVGVEFDEPLGKNDGSINGVKYFHAQDNHGSFVKPQHVQVGDFPVEDYHDEDEDEI